MKQPKDFIAIVEENTRVFFGSKQSDQYINTKLLAKITLAFHPQAVIAFLFNPLPLIKNPAP